MNIDRPAPRTLPSTLLLALALAGLAASGPGCIQKGPSLPTRNGAPRTFSAASFFKTTSYFGSSFSADGKSVLLTSDESGVFNVYRQDVASPARRKQLTHSTTNMNRGVAWFPSDDRFLYMADQGGNELTHLYVMESGGPRDLTPGKKLKASFIGFSGDDQSFWVVTNERNPKFFDLYRYDVRAGYPRTRLFTNDGGWMVSEVSRDGRWVALRKVRNNADSDIYLQRIGADGPEGKPFHVTPHKGNVDHAPLTFDPASRELYYVTDQHGEFKQAWAYSMESGQHRPVIKASWDVVNLFFSRNGRYRVSAVNADARTAISIVDTGSGKEVPLPELPGGDIKGVSISRDETQLAFYLEGDTSPANLHVIGLGGGDSMRRLTTSLNPEITPQDLVDGEVVRYPSFDGLKIPAILFKPKQASAGARAPALVWVHGGPGGQSRKGYSAMLQHLVNHGYAVLAVNNRGSSGYGKTFFHLDDRKHGTVDLQDCVYGRRYLESLPWVDGKRIGIMGGSYGGYIVAAALAFEPTAFEVGIDIFGVTNWVRTLESIPPWWSAFREYLYAELGDPATDLERLKRISPLFHAKNIVRPLLVVQGKNDPRVLQVESDELVAAVRSNNVPVEYLVFPDEGHGFTKRKNRIAASEAYLKFVNQHLRAR